MEPLEMEQSDMEQSMCTLHYRIAPPGNRMEQLEMEPLEMEQLEMEQKKRRESKGYLSRLESREMTED